LSVNVLLDCCPQVCRGVPPPGVTLELSEIAGVVVDVVDFANGRGRISVKLCHDLCRTPDVSWMHPDGASLAILMP